MTMIETDLETRAAEYSLSKKEADFLGALVLIPDPVRTELLKKYLKENGADRLIRLTANLIGMANAVVRSTREELELFLICEAKMYPTTAEKVNLPTMFGACRGAALSEGIDQEKLCGGCAFRKGSPANHSPSTTADVDWSKDGGGRFLCHEVEDVTKEPSKICRGFVQYRRKAGR